MTDSTTAIAAAPLVADVVQIVQGFALAFITGFVGLAAKFASDYLHLQFSAADRAAFVAFVDDLAAKEIAKAADNLATAQIDVHSPIVKAIADQVEAELPDLMTKLGITPQRVADMTTAAFGRLQARMTSVSPPTAKAS